VGAAKVCDGCGVAAVVPEREPRLAPRSLPDGWLGLQAVVPAEGGHALVPPREFCSVDHACQWLEGLAGVRRLPREMPVGGPDFEAAVGRERRRIAESLHDLVGAMNSNLAVREAVRGFAEELSRG
jgi:hypothetical protein